MCYDAVVSLLELTTMTTFTTSQNHNLGESALGSLLTLPTLAHTVSLYLLTAVSDPPQNARQLAARNSDDDGRGVASLHTNVALSL